MLDPTHLRDGHPKIGRHNITEGGGVVAILQSFGRRFQQLAVEVVVKLAFGGQRIPRNGFQFRQTFVEVADSRCDALSRIVPPMTILPRESHGRRGFGILLHPALPVFIEVGAEFSRYFVPAFIVAGAALRHRQNRKEKQPRSCREDR